MSSKEEEEDMKKERDVVLNRLEDVREELRRALVENAQQTHPRAKVKAKGTDVLVVDKERFEKLERQSKEEVAKAKRKVSEKIERLEREAEEIKRECFDGMETRRCAVTTFACEERDEIFRDPVAVTNFGIPKRKSDDAWEVDGVGKMQFLSEVGSMVSLESDVLEKSTLNNAGLASTKDSAGEDEERQIDRLLYDVHFQLQCTTPERMKMHHAMLLRSARIKKKKFNALFDDVVFEKSRVVDRAKTAWKKAKSIARCALKETPATQFEGIRTDSFYKIESGFEYGNAWDIVARLNALANTRPMHWLEEEGKLFDVCESEMSSRFLDESEDGNDDLDEDGSIKMNDINNDTTKSNNNAVSMKKALKSMFTRSSAENEDDSDGDEGDEDEDDEGNDDADVSDPSDDDDDEDGIDTNINIYEDKEAPFERNLRLRAKAERFEHKKNKKIREAKKIAFQRLLDIQDETVKNRVRLNHRVLELEQAKHKVEVEVLSLEYRAARVFERLSRIEILDDEYETMSRPDETLERLQREAREAKTAFENHGPELANAKMRSEATSDQLKMNERQFRRETRDSPAAAIHADTLLVLYRQDGPVLRKKNTSSSSASSSSNINTGHNATSTEASSLAAERTKLRRESVFSPASMMQTRSKSIVALTSSGGDVLAEKGATTAAAVATVTLATHNSKPATYFPISLDETWFKKLNAHRTQRQNLEKVKAQQKATRETCEVTLKVLEQTLDEATKRVTERQTYLKNQFNERFERANDCDVTMKLPCGLVETLLLDEDDSSGDDGDILYLPRNIVEELNTAANSRRETMINLRIANKKLTTSIECSKWCIEYAKRRNSEHIERARELALLRSSKSLQLFIKSGGYSKNSLEENNNKKKRNSTNEHGDGDDDDDDDDIDEKEIGDAANAKARFRHNDALHEKERKMCEERLNELEKKKAKLRKTIASLLIEDEHEHPRSPEMAHEEEEETTRRRL
ncbi:unnamed protein product [Bathycoccus prasinos]